MLSSQYRVIRYERHDWPSVNGTFIHNSSYIFRDLLRMEVVRNGSHDSGNLALNETSPQRCRGPLFVVVFFMSDELGMRVNDVRLKNRDVKCTSLFFKVGSKKDAMVFDWTKIIKKKKNGNYHGSHFWGYYHRWTQFVNHTGVMVAILQRENKIKLSFNFCNSLTLQRQYFLFIYIFIFPFI